MALLVVSAGRFYHFPRPMRPHPVPTVCAGRCPPLAGAIGEQAPRGVAPWLAGGGPGSKHRCCRCFTSYRCGCVCLQAVATPRPSHVATASLRHRCHRRHRRSYQRRFYRRRPPSSAVAAGLRRCCRRYRRRCRRHCQCRASQASQAGRRVSRRWTCTRRRIV